MAQVVLKCKHGKDAKMVEQLLYKPIQASDYLQLGRSKTYELIRTGALRSIRVGRAIRIPAAALREFVEQQEQQANLLGG